MDIVLLFPGQGSQKPGMGKDLAAAFPAARDTFAAADEALGVALSTLCFEGPESELTATQNAQPALITHAAALWAVLGPMLGRGLRATAGHSAGELAAYHAAGSLDLASVVRVVRRRGELMACAGAERPGAMAAILGLANEAVEDICRRATSQAGTVVPANYNALEQVVISGEVAGVERALALAKESGAKRAIRLNVSGAFHSPLMAPAAAGLSAALDEAPGRDPQVPVASNVTAEPVTRWSDGRRLLREQLTAPVRWAQEVTRLVHDHPAALFVELGPGAVLTNLMKRIAPGASAASCSTAADVARLLERVG